jgi:hypothetical protein
MPGSGVQPVYTVLTSMTFASSEIQGSVNFAAGGIDIIFERSEIHSTRIELSLQSHFENMSGHRRGRTAIASVDVEGAEAPQPYSSCSKYMK